MCSHEEERVAHNILEDKQQNVKTNGLGVVGGRGLLTNNNKTRFVRRNYGDIRRHDKRRETERDRERERERETVSWVAY